jgi:hypothetical protein
MVLSMAPMAAAAAAPAASQGRICQFSKTKMCRFELLGMCAKGKQCPFAHGNGELRPLPDLRNTKMCRELLKTGQCSTIGCAYAHGREELRATASAAEQRQATAAAARRTRTGRQQEAIGAECDAKLACSSSSSGRGRSTRGGHGGAHAAIVDGGLRNEDDAVEVPTGWPQQPRSWLSNEGGQQAAGPEHGPAYVPLRPELVEEAGGSVGSNLRRAAGTVAAAPGISGANVAAGVGVAPKAGATAGLAGHTNNVPSLASLKPGSPTLGGIVGSASALHGDQPSHWEELHLGPSLLASGLGAALGAGFAGAVGMPITEGVGTASEGLLGTEESMMGMGRAPWPGWGLDWGASGWGGWANNQQGVGYSIPEGYGLPGGSLQIDQQDDAWQLHGSLLRASTAVDVQAKQPPMRHVRTSESTLCTLSDELPQ